MEVAAMKIIYLFSLFSSTTMATEQSIFSCNSNGRDFCYSSFITDTLDCSNKFNLHCLPKWTTSVKSNVLFNGNQIQRLHSDEFQNQLIDLDGLAKVKRIDLSYNQLQLIESGTFNGLNQLETLNLAFNNLSIVPLSSFNDISRSLKFLSLVGNPIHSLQMGDFNSLSKLVELDLRYCKIQDIQENSFKGLNSLQILNLGYNSLIKLHSGSFNYLYRLENLNLDSNQLQLIDAGVFDCLPKLLQLNLQGNPLRNEKWFDLFDKSVSVVGNNQIEGKSIIPCNCTYYDFNDQSNLMFQFGLTSLCNTIRKNCTGYYKFEILNAKCINNNHNNVDDETFLLGERNDLEITSSKIELAKQKRIEEEWATFVTMMSIMGFILAYWYFAILMI